jgi:hypothetical protein
MTNETDAAVEDRHKNLSPKNLGADELSDGQWASSWMICENEYMLLEKHSTVQDVLKIPRHSHGFPEFSGACQSGGITLPDTIIAILVDAPGAKSLSAKFAWKIDRKEGKFIPIAVDGLTCPRGGIVTVDGGL